MDSLVCDHGGICRTLSIYALPSSACSLGSPDLAPMGWMGCMKSSLTTSVPN